MMSDDMKKAACMLAAGLLLLSTTTLSAQITLKVACKSNRIICGEFRGFDSGGIYIGRHDTLHIIDRMLIDSVYYRDNGIPLDKIKTMPVQKHYLTEYTHVLHHDKFTLIPFLEPDDYSKRQTEVPKLRDFHVSIKRK